MSQRPAAKREPLDGLQRSRYRKIKDINSGSYGFVQLCQDTRTNEQVAVKFIERGEKVNIYAVYIGVSIRALQLPMFWICSVIVKPAQHCLLCRSQSMLRGNYSTIIGFYIPTSYSSRRCF